MRDKTNRLGGFLAAALPFGVMIGITIWFFRGPVPGIFAGIVGGIAFGLALTNIQRSVANRFSIKSEDYEGARILCQGPANHFKGMESRGGWLILTEKALHFRNHRHNIDNTDLSLSLTEIASVRASNTLGVIPNGLLVSTDDGPPHRFVVQTRGRWLDTFRAHGM